MKRGILWILASVCGLVPVLALAQSIPSGVQLAHTLHFGESGADVTTLQTLLASNAGLYPEGLVTGYYGSLTRKAVMRLQANNGLEQVGDVGPKTLALVNRWLSQAAPAAAQAHADASAAVTSADAPAAHASPIGAISALTKTCANPWANSPATIAWPSGIACPAPVIGLITSLSPAASAAASSSTHCLSFLNSSSSLADFSKAVAQCPPESWTPDNTVTDYKTCSLSINGKSFTYPYTSGAACPTDTAQTTFDFNARCTLNIQGTTMTVPWPKNVACTGAIPGM